MRPWEKYGWTKEGWEEVKAANKAGAAEDAAYNASKDAEDKAAMLADIEQMGKFLVDEGADQDLIDAHRDLYRAASKLAYPVDASVPCRGKQISYRSVCASLKRRGITPRFGVMDL